MRTGIFGCDGAVSEMEMREARKGKTKEEGAEAGKGSPQLLGIRILESCRDSLYGFFPYLDGAFASVSYAPELGMRGIGTDGNVFYFQPKFLLSRYLEDPQAVRRGYLHMLLHCLFLHLFREKGRDRELWGLACDMAAEQMIEREHVPGLQGKPLALREQCFRKMGDKGLSAEEIYDRLEDGFFPGERWELELAFSFDDHSLWELERDPVKLAQTRRKWEKVLSYTGQKKGGRKARRGDAAGNRAEQADKLPASRCDYRKFLRRFAIPREEVELDTESFDYIFYHYGMEHYGNMPLIEPLEYKEVNRLEELVIAIDTSGSCSKEMVQRFLGETYQILCGQENFFRKMRVHLIQCDCLVQEAVVIHSEEEWKRYSKRIQIQGRGGTDFRPVFEYVERKQAKREIRDLKALIYFSDGDGIYPREKPGYETAFVFVEKSEKMELAPPWALRLVAAPCSGKDSTLDNK